MATKSYPLRIPEEILTISKLRAEEEHLDQSTAIRQFLYIGVEEYILDLVSEGRITIGKASEILHKSIYDLQRNAQKHGIPLGATLEQAKKSREFARKVFK